jgi:hypothetical protein
MLATLAAMGELYDVRQRINIYFLRAARLVRQTCTTLPTPTTVSSAYVWMAMAGAALTLAHGIRSFDFLHPGLLIVYVLVFLATEVFEERLPELQGMAPTFMLVAAIQLSLSEALTLALVWYGAQCIRDGRRNLHFLIVQGAFLIVAVGSVSVLVHASVFVKVLAIKATVAALCYFVMNYLSSLVIQSFDREHERWARPIASASIST